MKCIDCIYREYDSWNTPNGYFCERKAEVKVGDNDYMSSRIQDSHCCDVKIEYITGIAYGYEAKEGGEIMETNKTIPAGLLSLNNSQRIIAEDILMKVEKALRSNNEEPIENRIFSIKGAARSR